MSLNLELEILDVLGSDRSLVETSRVCTDIDKEMTESIVKKNIENLVRDKHWSVFDHAIVSYLIEVPIFVARQWMRHQQAYMEKSLRYTKNPELYQNGAYSKGEGVGQGNGYYDPIVEYNAMLGVIQAEEARRLLPLETMTTVQCTAPLRTLLHMIGLRLDSHAQSDTRELAGMLLEELTLLFPYTVESYLKWEYQSFSISVGELESIVDIIKNGEGDTSSLRRFLDNAKRRITVVRGVNSYLSERGKDSESDSVEDGGISVDNPEKVEEDGDKPEEGEKKAEARQLELDFRSVAEGES